MCPASSNRSRFCATAGACLTSTPRPSTIFSSRKATSPPGIVCSKSISGGAPGRGNSPKSSGPPPSQRDLLARSVNFRGDWNAEWAAYGPGVKEITRAFTDGINAYIQLLDGKWPQEFQLAGYAPGLWAPEDCVSRVAGLTMTRNLLNEVQHALDIQRLGLEAARKRIRLEPAVPLEIPKGLDIPAITSNILDVYRQAVGPVRLTTEQGSNNWVVDGSLTATGRPILANDPHRPVQLPSLAKDGSPGRAGLERDRRRRAGAAGNRART